MWTRHTERPNEREREREREREGEREKQTERERGIHKQVDVHTQILQHPALSHTASMKQRLRMVRNDTGLVENYMTLQRTTLNLWRTTLT